MVLTTKWPTPLCGKFSLLRIPWYGKIIEQIWKLNFYPPPPPLPTLIRPSQIHSQSQLESCIQQPKIGYRRQINKFYCVFTRFEGFCIEWKQKQKVVLFWPKVLVGPRPTPPPPPPTGPHHPKVPLFYAAPYLSLKGLPQNEMTPLFYCIFW